MPLGSSAEVSKTTAVPFWIVNAETGKTEKRSITLEAGYRIARINPPEK